MAEYERENFKNLCKEIEELYRRNHYKGKNLIDQYKIAAEYSNLGGENSDILNWKLHVEDTLFMKFAKVNRYIFYLLVLAVIVVGLELIPFSKAYLPTLGIVTAIWYVLNYVMNCRLKEIYLRLIRRIYT